MKFGLRAGLFGLRESFDRSAAGQNPWIEMTLMRFSRRALSRWMPSQIGEPATGLESSDHPFQSRLAVPNRRFR
jgi:hypothetical protein